MSVSLESENGIVAGAYPNSQSTFPHVGLLLCDPEYGERQILIAKLSPHDARAVAKALADGAERIEKDWDNWIVQTQGGFDDA